MITILSDSKDDQNYDKDLFTTSDPVKMYVEQIKMALESSSGSILGASQHFDLEDLVYEQNLVESDIELEVRSAISSFCSFYSNFETTIVVNFTNGELRDICLISIYVNQELAEKIIIT